MNSLLVSSPCSSISSGNLQNRSISVLRDARANPNCIPDLRRHPHVFSAACSPIKAELVDLAPQISANEQGDFEERHGYPLRTQPLETQTSQPVRLAYWLIPGRVLVGRYPFIHHKTSDRAHAELQIKTLLQDGVTTFLCLQAELPPQAKMKACGCNGFMAYKPIATMLHSTLTQPPNVEIIGSIRNKHLDQFLPQKRKSQESDVVASSNGLQFLHFPITDLSIPRQENVQTLIADLMARIENGEVLYIHCWGGRGRAGTIGACLLQAVYGMDADEALERVQRCFDTREDLDSFNRLRKSPETDEQREFVRNFKPL